MDAKNVPGTPRMSPLGFPIFIQEFEIIYIYGGTDEIKAQIAWEEDVRLLQCLVINPFYKLFLFAQGEEKRYAFLVAMRHTSSLYIYRSNVAVVYDNEG